jgi:hypothetical protein
MLVSLCIPYNKTQIQKLESAILTLSLSMAATQPNVKREKKSETDIKREIQRDREERSVVMAVTDLI